MKARNALDSAPISTTDDQGEMLRELLAGQQAILVEIAGLRALFERRRGARDDADRGLVLTLTQSVIGHRFTAREAFAHASFVPALAEALRAADVDSPKQLGKLLRRIEGRPIEQVEIQRAGVERDGIVWRLRGPRE